GGRWRKRMGTSRGGAVPERGTGRPATAGWGPHPPRKPKRPRGRPVPASLAPTSWGRYPTVTPLSRCTPPAPGSSTPARMRQRVVLPVPLGPQRPMRSPRPMRHDTSRRSTCPPYPLETASRAITRSPLLAHGLDAIGRDDVGHAHLVRLAVRIAIQSQVLPGEGVDVGICSRVCDLRDTALDLHVAVGVVGILDAQGHGGRAAKVLVLDSTLGRVDAKMAAIPVEPDRRHLRRSVGVDGREIGEGLLGSEEIIESVRHSRHRSILSRRGSRRAFVLSLIAPLSPLTGSPAAAPP